MTVTPATMNQLGISRTSMAQIPATPDMSMLTPESLLAYCRAQMDHFDGEIKSKMADQQSKQAGLSGVRDVMSWITSESGDGLTEADVVAAKGRLANLQKQNGVRSSEYQKIQHAIDKLDRAMAMAKEDGQDVVSAEATRSAVTTELESIVQDTNAQSEMTMIQLQSVLAKRQSVLQLTTNMMAAMNDQLKAIAQNVGR